MFSLHTANCFVDKIKHTARCGIMAERKFFYITVKMFCAHEMVYAIISAL